MSSSAEERQCSHGSGSGEEEEEEQQQQQQEAEHYCRAMQLVGSSVIAMVLQAATELDLFHILAKAGQASTSEISAQFPTTNPAAPAMIDRIVYFLSSHLFHP